MYFTDILGEAGLVLLYKVDLVLIVVVEGFAGNSRRGDELADGDCLEGLVLEQQP